MSEYMMGEKSVPARREPVPVPVVLYYNAHIRTTFPETMLGDVSS